MVNPRYIEEYHYDKVVLQNGISLEISRAKRENTRLMYMRNLEIRERERKENDNRINIGRNIYSDYAEKCM